MKAVLIYGGYDGGMLNDVWAFRNDTWEKISAENGPARLHAAFLYDEQRAGAVVIGGFENNGRTDEVWLLKNRSWSRIVTDGGQPRPRAEHEAVYIPKKGIFMFGGVVGPDPRKRVRSNGTWVLNGDTWENYNKK